MGRLKLIMRSKTNPVKSPVPEGFTNCTPYQTSTKKSDPYLSAVPERRHALRGAQTKATGKCKRNPPHMKCFGRRKVPGEGGAGRRPRGVPRTQQTVKTSEATAVWLSHYCMYYCEIIIRAHVENRKHFGGFTWAAQRGCLRRVYHSHPQS